MNETIATEEVILQENGIIRSKNGKILGHLIEHYNEFVDRHYNRGLQDAAKRVQKLWYEENNISTEGMAPREIGLHVGKKSGFIRAINAIKGE